MPDPLDSAFNLYPVGGLPGGDASRFLRVDFSTAGGDEFSQFESLIETKCPRLGWARAADCPCTGINAQTTTPDPVCPSCNGLGWRYFRPNEYVVDEAQLGPLDVLQQGILDKMRGVVIRGLLTGIATSPDIFQVLGKWALGSSMLSVRPRNRLGYYDRIVQLDEVTPFCEKHAVTEDSDFLPTRYPIHSVNFLGSLAQEFTDDDVELLEDGTVRFKATKKPETGTVVSINYMHHPAWVVIEYVNTQRTSLIKFRKAAPQTPQGDTLDLPIRVMVRREYLPMDPPDTAP